MNLRNKWQIVIIFWNVLEYEQKTENFVSNFLIDEDIFHAIEQNEVQTSKKFTHA